MIITKTPYRLSLFGGGTDYPAWYSKHPCRILSAAMANYCYITVKELPPFFEHKTRVVYSKIESVNTVDEIDHPSVRACLQHMGITGDISIVHDGDLPARSGIGSSSSFTVGLLNALHEYKNKPFGSLNCLAKEAIHIEQNVLGENVGIQDQIMAAYGGIRVIKMNENGWSTEELKLDSNYIKNLESHIMLGFSGVSRFSGEHSCKVVTKIKEDKIHSQLTDMAALADSAINSITRHCSVEEIGKLLHEGFTIKQSIGTEPWIDDIYQHSLQCGSLGGKLMGAGGGGFFMFLVPPERQEEFKKQMSSIKVWVPFKFDTNGSQIIHQSN
jgi:D-glycero-alpha-D-manno-heptose-7-phosphate kinase